MLNRIKRLIKLSKKDPKALERLTDKELEAVPEAGDGKAVFFGQGTQQEWDDEQKARKGLPKRIFGIE